MIPDHTERMAWHALHSRLLAIWAKAHSAERREWYAHGNTPRHRHLRKRADALYRAYKDC